MSLFIGVVLGLTVWATVALVVALVVGRAARLRDERERVDGDSQAPPGSSG
ncbi:hypothetical protein ACWDTI_21590 [Gordonia sp. NPDC003424]